MTNKGNHNIQSAPSRFMNKLKEIFRRIRMEMPFIAIVLRLGSNKKYYPDQPLGILVVLSNLNISFPD